MNNTVIQNRTDAFSTVPALQWSGAIRSTLAVITMAVIWISFQPFQGHKTGEPASSVLNQVGYLGLGLATVVTLLALVDWRITSRLVSLPWIVLFGALVLSAHWSPDPGGAYSAVAFTIIVTVLAASISALPRNADELTTALKVSSIVVLGLSYAGLLLFPEAAVHQAAEIEAIHAGFWRGIYTHKNIAGPVMAAISFGGIYFYRRGQHLSGILILLAAVFFMWNSGSKTAFALMPAVAIMVLLPVLMGMRGLSAFLVVSAVAVTYLFTIGIVYSPVLDSILRAVDPLTTYTGRTQIWEFAKPFVQSAAWFGYGYEGFWEGSVVRDAEKAFDGLWDPRGIIHGHNGYLDVALVMGVPMMLLTVWVTIIAPVIAYLRVPTRRENILAADFFFMIVAFAVMNAALESFFFRRADPVWLTLVFALFGLRLVSRVPLIRR